MDYHIAIFNLFNLKGAQSVKTKEFLEFIFNVIRKRTTPYKRCAENELSNRILSYFGPIQKITFKLKESRK